MCFQFAVSVFCHLYQAVLQWHNMSQRSFDPRQCARFWLNDYNIAMHRSLGLYILLNEQLAACWSRRCFERVVAQTHPNLIDKTKRETPVFCWIRDS
ncbi:hypothetical protein LZ554_008623 [Drepanopeziza brunnea f. sp. 'monogermtubi']|nr:hypothetical protein LZ554_008623 [Drepanopeziza brunnea f. sp. 'monogermtubi']